jgi:MSHA biogenesis protein MshP
MMKLSAKLQRGFSLITAIFLLVVLGTLGTMMVTFFIAQQQSSALDVLGSRAYQAARAGIEWAAYNVANQAAGAGCTGINTPLFGGAAVYGSLAGTLSPFTVSLTCSSVLAVEGASTIYVYDITSTAIYGGTPGNPDYVERVLSAKLAP